MVVEKLSFYNSLILLILLICADHQVGVAATAFLYYGDSMYVGVLRVGGESLLLFCDPATGYF